MKKITTLMVTFGLVLALTMTAGAVSAGRIRGDYLETRSADVYTGRSEERRVGKECRL